MKQKLSDYLAAFFADHGVCDCFMVTGGGAMHLDDAIGHNEIIRCTFNHHEQACAVAAEAYTRMTGKLALVCVTSGPGGTNAMTGVMGGWLDSIPMFVVSGQVKRETTTWSCPQLGLRQLGDQEFDVVHSVGNMTKYAVMVTEPNDIAYHLEKALYLATEGRGGPVWLDIPLDVQTSCAVLILSQRGMCARRSRRAKRSARSFKRFPRQRRRCCLSARACVLQTQSPNCFRSSTS